MGSLATLLSEAGHRISGSDPSPRPPMSTVLEKQGIEVLEGWRAENIDRQSPELVVVGNVCRRDNLEAVRAADLGHEMVSMPGAIKRLLVPERRPLVVAGTHGKTTTTALLGTMLLRAGLDPTVLVGGVVEDLGGSSRLGQGRHLVIEGDEYDSAFFEKVPKFWSYAPWGAVIGSVEHDHLDIYPDEESYLRAFEGFAERIAVDGLLAYWAADELAVEVAQRASCRLVPFAYEGDPVVSGQTPVYIGRLERARGGPHRLALSLRGPAGLRATMPTPLAGEHNARNTLAASILAIEAAGLGPAQVAEGLSSFRGVALRQQLIGTARSIRVYRDFAHHPEAVRQTIEAMRPLASPGRLVVSYEPRSATACRRLHQFEYARAFASADVVVLAPVGRPEIPAEERLDTPAIAGELRSMGVTATSTSSLAQVVEALLARVRPGDLVLLLSNGHFGHIDRTLLGRLGRRR